MCWYIEYLARHYSSPASISNAISHLRTFYSLSDISTRPLFHHRVGLALRSVAINIRHQPVGKHPVDPALLRAVMHQLGRCRSPEAMKLAILLMFMGFLRQSSVAPHSVKGFDHTRHLTTADITPTHSGLRVKLKWTKTLQSSADATNIMLPTTEDPALCPLRAYTKYMAVAPTTVSNKQPLLRHNDGNTLTVPFIRRQWALALAALGKTTTQFSLHSLRRGAAHYTYNEARADLNDVMSHGTWRSQAVRAYIKPDTVNHNSVHTALGRI